MWRSLLAVLLFLGIFALVPAAPAAAQLPVNPLNLGVCETTPCQGLGAFVTCAPGVWTGCPGSFVPCAIGCSCAVTPGLGTLFPTGVGISAFMGVRYATYMDGTPPLVPISGPNPQAPIADAIVPYSTCAGYMFPIFALTQGSFGYNVGPRRGFNPYATADAYLQTLNAVVAPDGTGYILSWTTGTTFSASSHEVFQCPEPDTPLVACRSVGVINAETRRFGPVPGGYTYVVRTQGYGGLTGTIGWGGTLEAGSSRLPLPALPPPVAATPEQQ